MKKGKKTTGGKYIKRRKKKSYERTGQATIVKLGDDKKKSKRIMGGGKKSFLIKARFVNVKITSKEKGKKDQKVEIKNVLETPSNRFLARQNVITKGTIVETELGNVKITNKPSQEKNLNGVLVQ